MCCNILQDTSSEEAQRQYMEIVRSWAGYGSTLFEVEVTRFDLSSV